MTRLPDASFRALLASPELSYAAKGVLAFVLTRPPGAKVGLAELFAASTDPIEQITKAVRELTRMGLVATRQPGRAGTGVAVQAHLQPFEPSAPARRDPYARRR